MMFTNARIFALLGLVLAAVAAGWYHTSVVAGLEQRIAGLEMAKAEEVIARQAAAREHAEQLAAVQSDHAAAQQRKEDAYAEETRKLQRARAADAADARSLRQQLAAATANRGAGCEADPGACQRDQARLEQLGRLAGEGAELLVEAQGLLAERELTIGRLVDQVQVDRAAVEAAAKREP